MSDLVRPRAWERFHLGQIEHQLRSEALALDHGPACSLLRDRTGPPDAWRLRRAWPVTAVAVLSCLRVAVSATRTDVLLLPASTYLLIFSRLGLWLPLSHWRTP